MNTLVALFNRFTRLFVWWVVIQPWERAVITRLGKRRPELGPGTHFRIPYADAIYRQSVRTRVSATPVQTLTTRDGKTLTLSASLSYCVEDLTKLYDTLHHGEDSIRNLACSAMAEYVVQHDAGDCTPERVQAWASQQMALERYGLGCGALNVVNFAFVRTYRFIADSAFYGSHGDVLNTVTADQTATGGPS